MPFTQLQSREERTKTDDVLAMIEASGKFVDAYLAAQEKKQKSQKDKIDAYVELRKAGYPEKEAYNAVEKWNLAALKGAQGAGDLDTQKKQKEIEKLDTDIAYKKKQTENMGKTGGFDTAEEIPATAGGLPLKSVKQDKKTGLWYGDYGKGSGDEDIEIPGMEGGSGGEKKEWTPPGWLSGIIGKWDKKSGVEKAASAGSGADQQEAIIQANMQKYGKSREEVIAALKKKGML